MTLPKGQRAIIAGFRTMNKAEQAAEMLSAAGIHETSIERVSLHPPTEEEDRLHNAVTGDYPGLANAVFDTQMDRDQSIMTSVSPSASGMSDGHDENIGTDVVLTAVVQEEQYNQAGEIITRLGGQF